MSKDSNYWLHVAADTIIAALPQGDITVSSGISPSANYHIGHFPEILNAEALKWVLRERGRQVRHVHVVDNMDPLRRRYDFLPQEYEQYVGHPICLVPNPYGEGSYADYFFEQFKQHFQAMGIRPDSIVKSYEDLYRTGAMAGRIEQVLEQIETVKAIFARFGREVANDWTPLQVIGEDGVFSNARIDTWDQAAQTIEGVSYLEGRVKLNWRLDWPARWAELGIDVEPFNNHEHGAAGGSYDTGAAFAREIFGVEAPLPGARYGNVHLEDDRKKMSSSKGNLITPDQVLRILPPGVLRYFVVRSKPPKNLSFYPGAKLGNLIDEYKQVAAATAAGKHHDFSDAYRFAAVGNDLTSVPFTHLINVYQAAGRELDRTADILARTGYEVSLPVLTKELEYIDYWLDNYAPADMKFELQQQLPKVELTTPQQQFLAALADSLATQEVSDATAMHELIYQLKDNYELKPAEAFSAIYQVLLGRKSGPKAGWYLTTIERDWLINRLKLER